MNVPLVQFLGFKEAHLDSLQHRVSIVINITMMRSAFPTIILLFVVIRAHSGDGLNLKVVGDAIIIEGKDQRF